MRNTAQIRDIRYAVQLYYSRIELQNKEIAKLFNIGGTAVQRKKKEAEAVMEKKGIPACGVYTVNTEAAYEAWGLDIAELERRLAKIEKYGNVTEEPEDDPKTVF